MVSLTITSLSRLMNDSFRKVIKFVNNPLIVTYQCVCVRVCVKTINQMNALRMIKLQILIAVRDTVISETMFCTAYFGQKRQIVCILFYLYCYTQGLATAALLRKLARHWLNCILWDQGARNYEPARVSFEYSSLSQLLTVLLCS